MEALREILAATELERAQAVANSALGRYWAACRADPQPEPAQGGLHVSEAECRRLLFGFAMDCNAIGIQAAAENLLTGMKAAAAGLKI